MSSLLCSICAASEKSARAVAVAEQGPETTCPVSNNTRKHGTYWRRNDWISENSCTHEADHFRLGIFGTISIRIHFNYQENPVLAIRENPTNGALPGQ
jgi:hypothetical protein